MTIRSLFQYGGLLALGLLASSAAAHAEGDAVHPICGQTAEPCVTMAITFYAFNDKSGADYTPLWAHVDGVCNVALANGGTEAASTKYLYAWGADATFKRPVLRKFVFPKGCNVKMHIEIAGSDKNITQTIPFLRDQSVAVKAGDANAWGDSHPPMDAPNAP